MNTSTSTCSTRPIQVPWASPRTIGVLPEHRMRTRVVSTSAPSSVDVRPVLSGASEGSATTTVSLDASPTVQLNEDVCRQLLETNPNVLLRHLARRTLDAADTALAAEMVGERLDSAEAILALRYTLSHPSSVAREGAIFGLGHHLATPGVREALRRITSPLHEPSAAVRDAASYALEAVR